MTTVVTADIHLSANPRDAYRIKWCEGLPVLLKKEKADRLIILGDLTSEKDYHGAWLTNKVVSIIRACAEVCPVYILQGNHDWQLNPNVPFFGFLDGDERIRWIKEIKVLKLKGLGRCLFIPHQRKLDVWHNMVLGEERWEPLKEEWSWVFAHATFEGSKSESGEELTGAPTGAVLGHRVISGDVHVPQKLGPVTYVGPPYTINFGDSYQPRILLLAEHSVNQRLCEGPRKVLLEVDAVDDLEARAGDIVKVRYEIAAPDYDKWPSIRRKIEQWAAGIKVDLDSVLPVPRVEDSPDSKRRTVVSSKEQSSIPRVMDDEAVMEAYCERCRVGEKTLNLGLRLMEKAPG